MILDLQASQVGVDHLVLRDLEAIALSNPSYMSHFVLTSNCCKPVVF